MGMKILVLLLLLSVVAANLVHSLPTGADMSEEQDAEGLFSPFLGCHVENKESWAFPCFF